MLTSIVSGELVEYGSETVRLSAYFPSRSAVNIGFATEAEESLALLPEGFSIHSQL